MRNFPILSVLGLIFITLKLMGYITWSWWWVLLPFWGPLFLTAAFLILVGLMYGWDKIKVKKVDK